jgi:RNA polymerase sigma-70 factor (ECF subfamily)
LQNNLPYFYLTHSDNSLFHRVLLENEIALVRAAADGDQNAYGQLYTYYYPNLQAAITFIIKDRDETDEILQETFLRIWRGREKLLLVRSFEDYAFKIAKNLLFDVLRRKKVHLKAMDAIGKREMMTDGGDNQLVYKEFHDIAIRAINGLDPQKREIFLLRTEEGLSFEEIAERCGIAVVTAKKHFYAAFHALKELLKVHGGLFSFLFILWARGK